jgi:hypothetical protein
MGAGQWVSPGQTLDGVGGQKLGIDGGHACFQRCGRHDAQPVAQIGIGGDPRREGFYVLEARSQKKHLAAVQQAANRPQAGEPVDFDAGIEGR